MKKMILRVATVMLLLAFVCPAPLSAQDRATAITIKGGIYNGVDDLEEGDTGGNFAISYNRYFSPNFALEAGLGYFSTEATFADSNVTLGSFTEKDELSAIPLTVNAKGILPLGWGELYGGVGLGAYFVDFDASLNSETLGSATLSDNDTIFGFQVLAGLLFNISETIYLGIEGQYIGTGDAEASGVVFGESITLEGNLNGYTVSGVLGFRF